MLPPLWQGLLVVYHAQPSFALRFPAYIVVFKLLLLSVIVLLIFGIIDDLGLFGFSNLPPLSWSATFLIIISISVILLMQIEDICTEMCGLYEKVIHDELAGVFSRGYFEVQLEKDIDYLKRENRKIYLVMLDVDNFKEINDTYGHSFGDSVLKSITKVIKNTLRPTDLIAGLGGDEFAGR